MPPLTGCCIQQVTRPSGSRDVAPSRVRLDCMQVNGEVRRALAERAGLVPRMGYDDLDISDGRATSAQYMQALRSAEQEERQQTFDDLRAYCERDTLAIMRLH